MVRLPHLRVWLPSLTMSRWIRGHLQPLAKLDDGLAGLQAFFARAAAEFPYDGNAVTRKSSGKKRPLKAKNTNQQTTRYSEMKKGPLEVLWSNAAQATGQPGQLRLPGGGTNGS